MSSELYCIGTLLADPSWWWIFITARKIHRTFVASRLAAFSLIERSTGGVWQLDNFTAKIRLLLLKRHCICVQSFKLNLNPLAQGKKHVYTHSSNQAAVSFSLSICPSIHNYNTQCTIKYLNNWINIVCLRDQEPTVVWLTYMQYMWAINTLK